MINLMIDIKTGSMSLSVKTIRKSLKLFGASDLQHSGHLLDHLQMLNYHKNKHERKISSRNSPVTVKNHKCFFCQSNFVL